MKHELCEKLSTFCAALFGLVNGTTLSTAGVVIGSAATVLALPSIGRRLRGSPDSPKHVVTALTGAIENDWRDWVAASGELGEDEVEAAFAAIEDAIGLLDPDPKLVIEANRDEEAVVGVVMTRAATIAPQLFSTGAIDGRPNPDADQARINQRVLRSILTRSLDVMRGMDAFETALVPWFQREVLSQLDELVELARQASEGTAQLQAVQRLPDYTGTEEIVAAADKIRARPTELLIAKYRAVPYQDRGDLLKGIVAWATATGGRRAQGRLYTAPGGFGKTRLGIELIRALPEGWRTRYLSRMLAARLSNAALNDLFDAEGADGICVVIDYAEGQVEALNTLADAAALATEDGPPIRLLALARSADWWDGFVRETGPAAVFAPEPIEAVERSLGTDERTALFDGARTAFLEQFARLEIAREPGEAFTPDLSGEAFDRPLAVVAAAFVAALGLGETGESVFETLYQEERKHWRRVLGNKPDDAPEVRAFARSVAQLTLVQGAIDPGVRALVEADPADRKLAVDDLLPALHRLYGRRGFAIAEGETPAIVPFIGPVEPDLLGEHTAMRVLAQDNAGLIDATMKTALSGPPLFAQDAGLILTVLVRATRPEHDDKVRRAAEAAIARLIRFAQVLDREAVTCLRAALPERSTALLALSVAVNRRRLDLTPPGTTEEEQSTRARAAGEFGNALFNLGRREEALEATAEAVSIYRELVVKNRDAFLPDLASSLNNQGGCLSNLGRREEALEVTAEAVSIRRELVVMNRDAFLPDLASSLNNLGFRYSSLRRREEALEATAEAVSIRRELVVKNRDAFLPDLSFALNNISVDFANIGRREEALEASAEAVSIRRELVAKNRDAFLPDLASSLNNHGAYLSSLGRREEALEASAEAVSIRRELVVKNRDAFLPDLVTSLGVRGQALLAIERPEEAAEAFLEGTREVRPLTEAMPQAFGELFANLLRDYVGAAQAAGRDEDAVRAVLAELGVSPEAIAEGAVSEAIGHFRAWAEAHDADDGDAAHAAYAALVAALDGALDDTGLDPVRDAVHEVLAQFDDEAPYAPAPQRPRCGAGFDSG